LYWETRVDDKLRIFAWIAGSGAFFGLLGGLFGALTGALYWQTGKASGTALGLRVAEAFARISGRELSHRTKGALVGAVDGFLFLGMLGAIAGAAAGFSGRLTPQAIGPIALGAVGLVGGAAFFGLLAYTMTRTGVLGLAGVCMGGVAGAALGYFLGGRPGLLAGLIVGVVTGNLGMLWIRWYAPQFLEVRLDAHANDTDHGPDEPEA
jgi:hypothetical protein